VLEYCLECPDQLGQPCPPGGGDTGGEEPGPVLSCQPSDHSVCFVGDVVLSPLDIPGGLELVDSATCPNLSRSFPCNERWDDGVGAVDYWCSYCDITDLKEDDPGLVGVAHDFDGVWPMCAPGDGTARLATKALNGIGPWYDRMNCGETGVGFGCDPHHYRYDGVPSSYAPTSSVTCACPEHTDEECQPGAVCEALFLPVDHHGRHFWTQPTMCTWDGPHGTSSPHLPPVPGEFWAPELVWMSGESVSILPEVFLWLTHAETFDRFDAAPVFDSTGEYVGLELTRADLDSLPTYLGLEVGDLLVVDQATSDALARGEHDIVEVRTDAGSRWLDVVVE